MVCSAAAIELRAGVGHRIVRVDQFDGAGLHASVAGHHGTFAMAQVGLVNQGLDWELIGEADQFFDIPPNGFALGVVEIGEACLKETLESRLRVGQPLIDGGGENRPELRLGIITVGARDFRLDDLFGSVNGLEALAPILVGQCAEIGDVAPDDPVQVCAGRFDVMRDGQVDQKQRTTVVAGITDPSDGPGSQDRVGRGGR